MSSPKVAIKNLSRSDSISWKVRRGAKANIYLFHDIHILHILCPLRP
jgi:hypothetical protein